MARSRRRNMKTTKNKESAAGKDDSTTNPASPTARAPSPMLPPPSEMLSRKGTTPKQKSSTLYKVGKKVTKTKQRPQTASSVTKKRTKTKKNGSFNKKQKQPGHAKQAKRTRSSSKLSAHMLALWQARNINPLALKRKNSTKSSVSKQRPVSSMGIRKRQPLASKLSTRNGGEGRGGKEEKATGIRSKQVPTIASNLAKENEMQPSILISSTHTKHRHQISKKTI